MTNPDLKSSNTYSTNTSTSIWNEIPSDNNPYIAAECRLHGYDLIDITRHSRYIDVLYLLFKGELPTVEQSQLLESLMISTINLGPRHPATRAAMNAGVSKTNHEHLLPIGLMVLGGSSQGSSEVAQSISFFLHNSQFSPREIAGPLLEELSPREGDRIIAPGFGSFYGGRNPIIEELAIHLGNLPGSGRNLEWGQEFSQNMQEHQMGWLMTGLAAAVLADLGFEAREGAGLFQVMCAPGLLAHGLEQSHKPIFAMPMLEDDKYVVERKK